VGQHGALCSVADGEDVVFSRPAGVVLDDETTVIRLDSGVLQADVIGVWPPADGHQHLVIMFRDGLAINFDIHIKALGHFADFLHFGFDHDFFETTADLFDHHVNQIMIGTGEQAGEELHHRNR